MSLRQRQRRGIAAGALAAGLSLALLSCTSGRATSGQASSGQASSGQATPGHAGSSGGKQAAQTQPNSAGPAGFAWFRPGAAPAAWRRASLPGQQATLFYPNSLRPMPGDHGTVTVGRDSRSGTVLAYLNVTPRQGDETLRDWPGFRLAHLRDDGTTAVHLDGVSPSLHFRGGQGRCVIDNCTTKIHSNHYQEIACFVQGTHAASVLVAATSARTWLAYRPLLDQVVSSYQAG
jgi:hypothetical protein